jgi:hypothetical protein
MSFEQINGGHAALKLTAPDSELLGLGGFLNLLECPGRSAALTFYRIGRTLENFGFFARANSLYETFFAHSFWQPVIKLLNLETR